MCCLSIEIHALNPAVEEGLFRPALEDFRSGPQASAKARLPRTVRSNCPALYAWLGDNAPMGLPDHAAAPTVLAHSYALQFYTRRSCFIIVDRQPRQAGAGLLPMRRGGARLPKRARGTRARGPACCARCGFRLCRGGDGRSDPRTGRYGADGVCWGSISCGAATARTAAICADSPPKIIRADRSGSRRCRGQRCLNSRDALER